MATSYKSQTVLRGIKSEEFGAFLNHKGIKSDCPLCGQESAINVSGAGGDVAITASPIAKIELDGKLNTDSGAGLATASIACRNCGYMRTFGLNVIIDWLNEQQEAKSKNNEQ